MSTRHWKQQGLQRGVGTPHKEENNGTLPVSATVGAEDAEDEKHKEEEEEEELAEEGSTEAAEGEHDEAVT